MSIHILVEYAVSSPSLGFSGVPQTPSIPDLDPNFAPIRIPGGRGASLAASGLRGATFVVRAEVDDEIEVEKIQKTQGVVSVWSDPQIDAFGDIKMNPVNPQSGFSPSQPVDCASDQSTGSSQDVVNELKVRNIWDRGFTGQNVTIGILDGGVDGSQYPVDGGWSPSGNPGDPNVAWGGHGNMCAYDALIAAPDARIFDYAIGKSQGGIPVFLSSALQAFDHALESYRSVGFPQILSNSWGLYQDAWDPYPPGDPRNYTHNASHPFTRKVVETMDAGILVAFAAGNCGDGCHPSDPRCGADVGPGRSIRGANGHGEVICVGAVNLQRDRVGYSSQGPSTLDAEKPDLCGFTHFMGHTTSDNGTSAACPVVAGVLATLRSAFPDLRQRQARETLCNTATNPGPVGWNPESGHGVVNAAGAYEQLRAFRSAPRP